MNLKKILLVLFCALFLIKSDAQNNTQLITAIQYYYDNDPGLGIAGNGAIVLIAGTSSSIQSLNFNVPNLSLGVHNLYVRAKDEFGQWSLVERRTFLVESLNFSIMNEVVAYQYFYDTDPGVGIVGNGGIVSITPSTNFNQNVSLNLPNLIMGIHNLFIRAKDQFGRWSIVEKRSLFVDSIESNKTESITSYQYFFDNDPGVGVIGNGAIISISPTDNYSQSIIISLPALSNGIHNLYIRAKDENGKWGLAERKTFLVEPINVTNESQIVAYQYYFDTDPGVGNLGNGEVVSITPTNNFNQTITINIPTLNEGIHHLFIRAKNEDGLWSLIEQRQILIDGTSSLNTQNIIAYQYYFDTDPGFNLSGNGAMVAVTPTQNFNQTIAVDVPTLTEGFHELYLRVMDQNNNWSIIERRTLFVDSISLMNSSNILAYQYYFDTDPGINVIGNGAIVSITPTTIFSQSIIINVPALNEGIHYLFIRAKDENGIWSVVERRMILVESVSSLNTQQIVAYQYYFDGDSSTGNSSIVSVSPSASINQTLNIPIPILAEGFHELYLRAKDQNNNWSIVERRFFFVDAITELNLAEVVAYQYYFDTDPGLDVAGNGAIVSITPTSNFNQTVAINLPALIDGIHYLYIRAKDSYGHWSLVETRLFIVDAVSYSNTENIIAYQYYFDSDPGNGIYGNGDVVSITPTTNLNQSIIISIPSLNDGFHELYIRAQSQSGIWSIVEHRTIYIEAIQPVTNSNIVAYQYYFDIDPGLGIVGNGNIIPINPVNDFNQTIAIHIPSLQDGIHYLFVRAKNLEGKWSIAERRVFLVDSVIISNTDTIVAYQYYFDNDPGLNNIGNGNVVNISPTTHFNQSINLNVPLLSSGIHNLYLRVKDSKGKWSLIERRMLLVEGASSESTEEIVAYQYFFDNDPGVGISGNGAVVSANQTNTFNETILLNTPPLNIGVHYLYIRAKDQKGRWSIIERDTLFVTNDTINLKLFIQGYYEGGGFMRQVLYNQGLEFDAAVANVDTVIIEFRNYYYPYSVISSVKGILKTNGSLITLVPANLEGNTCYIVIKHRNAIETWSANPVFMSSSTYYDFSSNAAKAYSSNQVDVSNNGTIWALYSGDITQDNNIDLLDLTELESNINDFLFGYFATDINGDGNVDLLDSPILEANVNNFIFSSHP